MNLTIINDRLDQLQSEVIRLRNGRIPQILQEIQETRSRIANFIGTSPPPQTGDIIPLADLEKAAILNAVARCHDGRKAAAALGIGVTTLYRKWAEYRKEAQL